MSPFVCFPRGGTPCIDDVCRSMGECAWPPPKESSGLINDDEKAEQLYKLADEYHQRCDDFDEMIVGRHDAHTERQESIRNAREVDRELFHKAEELGYDKETWRAARRRATPR